MASGFPSVSNLNTRDLHNETSTVDDTITWLRQHGLLATTKNCRFCGHSSVQCRDRKRSDGYRWRCPNGVCRKESSIREGSIFGGDSRLELKKVVDLLYHYAYEISSVHNLMRECRMATEAIVKWKKYVRDIFAEFLVENSSTVGGVDHVVEIDETAFGKRRDNMGKKFDVQIAFGGIDVESKDAFLVTVPERDADNLLSVLGQYVLPGTTVISQLWETYSTMDKLEYQNLTTDYNLNLVDVHRKSIWSRTKQKNKRENRSTKTNMDSYFVEFIWRQKFNRDPFESLLAHIRASYPFENPPPTRTNDEMPISSCP